MTVIKSLSWISQFLLHRVLPSAHSTFLNLPHFRLILINVDWSDCYLCPCSNVCLVILVLTFHSFVTPNWKSGDTLILVTNWYGSKNQYFKENFCWRGKITKKRKLENHWLYWAFINFQLISLHRKHNYTITRWNSLKVTSSPILLISFNLLEEIIIKSMKYANTKKAWEFIWCFTLHHVINFNKLFNNFWNLWKIKCFTSSMDYIWLIELWRL